MAQAMKLNDKAPANTPPAQTPPCNPTDRSRQQSVTTGDGYQHSEARELVDPTCYLTTQYSDRVAPSGDSDCLDLLPIEQGRERGILDVFHSTQRTTGIIQSFRVSDSWDV
ncbi:hypothetical protein RJZ57_007753 [Blastomyces gilchristii]